MISQRHCDTLELPKILQLLSECCGCEDSKQLAFKVTPKCDFPDAVRLLNLTVAANTLSNRFGYPGMYRISNCASSLRRAQLGSRLSLRELLEISSSAAVGGAKKSGVKMTERERRDLIADLENKMRKAAQMLEYEIAAQLRDEIIRLRGEK